MFLKNIKIEKTRLPATGVGRISLRVVGPAAQIGPLVQPRSRSGCASSPPMSFLGLGFFCVLAGEFSTGMQLFFSFPLLK